MQLTLSEEESAPIKADEFTTDDLRTSLTLAGKLFSDKAPNLEGLKGAMKRAFGANRGLEIEAVGENIFLFHFSHKVDSERAWLGGPWSFDRQLLCLQELNPDVSSAKLCFEFCPFYVRILDLPTARFTLAMATLIGNKIGEFLGCDDLRGSGVYLRIKVKINLGKPLCRIVRVVTETGAVLCLRVTYEKLPNYCDLCGHLNHVEKACPSVYSSTGSTSLGDRPFGAWLRAEERVGGRRTEEAFREEPPYRLQGFLE